MKKTPTINDVAKLAGVSKATVSKYLNETPYVSINTKQRIEKAIDELKYHPSNVARGLVSKSIRLIALVISDIELLINSVLIKSIETEAQKYGYDIVLVTTNDDEEYEQNLNEILTERYKHVDGIILANSRKNGLNLSELKETFEHIVMVHRYVPNDLVDIVAVDNVFGGKLVAEYLLRMGHEMFGIISGPNEISPFADRKEGFCDSLYKHNNQVTIIEGLQSLEAGYQAAEQLMTSESPPSAVFATSDILALGVLDAAKDYGWKIPSEISLIGYDNIFFGRLARVPLTTLDGQFEQLGSKSVQLLYERISEENKSEVKQIFLRPSLIVRESSQKKE
ncbi:LacI family DNA-binding transcriptional regulator [Salicibibacter cibarius]|uniref:LacI family DNA-binding transcriptional regulator n=1 Tax=Salicibibacter cibarius TaxID=2743000 RepID=A0A7T6Z240_9BACI|nr:LacI family DNA-binding transcriptional regulator [Salicibibacter cibarius]QQK75383.1 LacI family DNA-binding transcriptional regulator [Salicibibacter cibarius]